MKKLVIEEPVLYNPRHIQELLEKIISEKVLPQISGIKTLEEELKSKHNKVKEIEEDIAIARRERDRISRELTNIKGQKDNHAIMGVLATLFGIVLAVALSSNPLGLLIGSTIFLGGILGLSKSSDLGKKERELRRRLQGHEDYIRELEKTLASLKKEIEELERRIKEYKPPRVRIRQSKVYVPILLKKVSEGRFLVATPWSKHLDIEIPLIVEEQYIEEGLDKLLEGEEAYVEGVIREKDAGTKIIRALTQAGLWGRVTAAKAPEVILRDSAAEARSLIGNAISDSKAEIPYEELGEEDVKLIAEAVKRAKPLKAELEAAGEREILEKSRLVSELLRAASSLENMRRYLSQAELFLEKKELYEELAEKVLRKLLEDTIPIDSDYYKAIHSTLLCRNCADRGAAEYRYAADFQEWVFSHVLAGVNMDPDILYPPPIIEDYVKERWKALLKKTYYTLKLPGVREDAPLEELEKRYREEVYKMTALLAGAHEEVVLQYTSPFTPPTLRCNRCGAEFSVDEAPRLRGLETSIYKGYLALFSEFVDHFADKTATQRKSVADARRSKDERKTMAGIYEQTYHMYRIKQLEVESELKRSQLSLEELEKTLEPSIEKKAVELEALGAKGLEKVGKLLKKLTM